MSYEILALFKQYTHSCLGDEINPHKIEKDARKYLSSNFYLYDSENKFRKEKGSIITCQMYIYIPPCKFQKDFTFPHVIFTKLYKGRKVK